MKIKIILLTISILILSVIIYSYINKSYLIENEYNQSLKYSDDLIMEKIKNEFISNKIPFKQNKNGYLFYRSKDEDAVENILKKYDQKYFDESPRVSFPDEVNRKYFIKLLEESNIPYQLRDPDANARIYIVWDKKHDEKVQVLIKKVFDKVGITRKPIRLNVDNRKEQEYLIALFKKEKIPYKLIEDKYTNEDSGPDIEYEWEYYEKVEELKRKADLWIRQQSNN